MTLETLRAMANGGMHDQLGGGFHRYSVDERWFVPHFEKMLYDQAQLAISYLEAFQITHDPFYAKIARSTLDYVLRDMTHPEGGFYSAEDADSVIDPANPKEKGEGAFYIWSAEELRGVPEVRVPSMAWSRTAMFPTTRTASSRARTFCICASRWTTQPKLSCRPAKAALLAIRSKRVRPHLDDKILTAWNGLMISAFAKGAQVLDEPRYLEAAQRAASFILTRMYDAAPGLLLRRYRDGDAAIPGFLDDYAFFIGALLDLYEADFDPRHMETAIAPDRQDARAVRRPGRGRVLQHRCRRQQSGAAHEGRLRRRGAIGKRRRIAGSAAAGALHRSRGLSRSGRANAQSARVEDHSAGGRGAADAGRARLLSGARARRS